MARAGMRPPKRGRLGRLARRWRPDRNPLRRASDRAEAVLLAALLLLFLAMAPVAAVTAGGWAAAAGRPAAGGGTPHHVTAVLLRDAPVLPRPAFRGSAEPMVLARWVAPDGTARTGMVYARAGTPAGQTVETWINDSGRRVNAPPSARDRAINETLLALLAVVAVGLVLAGAGLAGHRLLERRRLAAWDVSWSATGPQWTGRR